MVVPDLLSAGVRRFPTKACVVEGDRSHSFTRTHERAARLARALGEHGVRPGDRVAILAMNELEYTEVLVGCMRAGAALVPLNYRFAAPELEFVLENSGASLLICGPGLADAAAQLRLPTWQLGGSYEEALGAAAAGARDGDAPAPQDAGAAVQILYTSGTTGRPKGAVLTAAGLHARLNMFAVETGVSADGVLVQALPMFHIAAHVAFPFTYVGGTSVMIRAFDPIAVLDAITRNAATHLLLVPTLINAINAHPATGAADLRSLRRVVYGASPIAPEVLRAGLSTFGCEFHQFYGMTETFAITMLRPADHDPSDTARLASAGTDALGIQSRVVDGDGNPVEPGTVGEIVARGPTVMTGYWGDPKASADALRGGWMHTGDLGYISPEDGYLHVVDRVKDMVVTGGENVYPREVEDVLFEHPAIYEAAVIGIPHDRWGEQVHAVVVAHPGRALTETDVVEHCRGRLAGYKIPKSVEFVAELPRNAPGKVLKTELRERHWAARSRQVG
jgi:acyl-CoA synthetase (AMP-forming)/AMP-acid ligase II